MRTEEELFLLPLEEYVGVDHDDPIRQYQKPFFGKLYKKRVELCLQECSPGERVLEVGFGSGVTFFNLAKKYKEIHGIDLRADTAAITAMFAAKGLAVSLKNGNLLSLPYDDACFDTVLLISILEHLQPADLDHAFQEIWRVLKPGGQVVYGVPSDSAVMQAGFFMLGYNIKKHHFSSPKQVRQSAQKNFDLTELIPLKAPLVKVTTYEIGNYHKR